MRVFKGVGNAWIVQPHMADHPGGETRNYSRLVLLSIAQYSKILGKEENEEECPPASISGALVNTLFYVVEDVSTYGTEVDGT